MRSIIFVDIDGVLNSQQTRVDGHLPAPHLLDNLKHVVESTNAELVMSSTWRLELHTRRAAESAVASRGLAFVGSTPDMSHSCSGDRVDEILAWLSGQSVAWVALDDMDLCAMNSRMTAQHFVHTDDKVGFGVDQAQEAIEKLQAQCALLVTTRATATRGNIPKKFARNAYEAAKRLWASGTGQG